MIIGSIKEQTPDETRSALTPDIVNQIKKLGLSIKLQKDYGIKAGFTDKEYINAGAEIIVSAQEIYKKSHIILQILPPSEDLLQYLNPDKLLIADFSLTDITQKHISCNYIRLELIPRISKLQNIDILSAQATVRGYTGALYALAHSPRLAPQLITAATSIKSASALIIGASVTGLQAATVFKRQGCRVTILDINEKTRELAKSVGADFTITSSKDELIALIKDKNFIFATASAGNGSSPRIIEEANLEFLPIGSVVIDTTQNNINITENTKQTTTYHFYRNLNMERFAPLTASELWANNMYNLILKLKTPNNTLTLNSEDLKPMLFTSKNS